MNNKISSFFELNSDWNLSLNEFQTKFKKNNVLKDLITLKNELANIRKQDLVKKLFTNINYTNVTNKIESQSIPLRSNYIISLLYNYISINI